MYRRLVGVVLVVLGLSAMANPLVLPVEFGGAEPEYVHTVQPVDSSTPAHDESAVLRYAALPADAREAFDRAREDVRVGTPGEYVVTDPAERAAPFDYPAEPSPGNGFYVVEHDGEAYELWTRTVTAEGLPTVFQRLLLQPALFLGGFFGIVAGLVLIGEWGAWGGSRRGS